MKSCVVSTFWRCCAFGIACAELEPNSSGAIIEYRATGIITSSDYPGEVTVGDQFFIDFAYDDSIRDTDTRTTFGHYPLALRSLSFQLIPGLSSGSYVGGLSSPGYVSFQPDHFRVGTNGGMFAPLGGHPFRLLHLRFVDPTPTSPISDPGGTPTLGEVVQRPVELDDFDQAELLFVTDYNKTGMNGLVTSVTVVPEPSGLAFLAIGIIAASQAARCRGVRRGSSAD